VGAFLSEPTLHLRECSRWPERQDCGQDCLQQIEADPENCLVWTIVVRRYVVKSCVFCHKQIDRRHHLDHAPVLLGPDFKTREWKDVRAEQLPDIFFTRRTSGECIPNWSWIGIGIANGSDRA